MEILKFHLEPFLGEHKFYLLRLRDILRKKDEVPIDFISFSLQYVQFSDKCVTFSVRA